MIKKITVSSGKGGTGKTSITAALAALIQNEKQIHAVFADCDVDASNLPIIFDPETSKVTQTYSGIEFSINKDLCKNCGLCKKECRFQAIEIKGKEESARYSIIPHLCEGCGMCSFVCPHDAVVLQEAVFGKVHEGDSRFGKIFSGELNIGGENSGKLVSVVRKQAEEYSAYKKGEWKQSLVLTDGPPGIGCAAISSLTGADFVIAVSEPTVSAEHDLFRLITVCKQLQFPFGLIINKSTISPERVKSLRKNAEKEGGIFLGEIDYNRRFSGMQKMKKAVTEEESELKDQIISIWKRIKTIVWKEMEGIKA